MRLIACWFLTDKMTRYSYSLFIAVMLAYGFWPPSFFDYFSFWRCVFFFLFFFLLCFYQLDLCRYEHNLRVNGGLLFVIFR